MKTFLAAGSALVLLTGVVSAQAQAADKGPVAQNSQAMAAADQAAAKPMSIRQQIQDQMSQAGYTDVIVTPSSFYIHAKSKQGDPVAMVMGPDSFTEVTEMPASRTTAGSTAATPPASPTTPVAKP